MKAFIISDNEAVTLKVRQVLLREGHLCPAGEELSLDLALSTALGGVSPDLLVVVLSPQPERVLACLGTLRALSPAHLLVVGPTTDSRLVLRALRAGAADYVDEADPEADLPAAVARLQNEMSPQGEVGRTIAVLAPNGGSGSSTLAVNIATVLAKEHKRSLLFDLKLAGGDLASLLDLKPTHTLADLCQNVARMDRVMFQRSLVEHSSGVHLLASPGAFADIGFVTAEGVAQALHLARSLFPYVVVDLDHSFRDEQLQVLCQADVILLVVRLEFTSLRNGRRTLDYLEQLGIDRERVRLVVNRYGQPKEIPAAKAEEALGFKIVHYIPDDPKTINRANNNGVPAVMESPSAKVSKSVTRLAMSVNGQHKK
ncbi:MAG TPA: P-loop NTPase [Gemmataceae bacterium]